MNINEIISNRIKEARKACKLNQQDFAEKVGVSLMTVKRWENPKINRTPNVPMLVNIAKALNTSEEYLIGLVANSPPATSVKSKADVGENKNLEKENINSKVDMQIVYNYGDHHLELPATEAGYAAFNNFVATIAAKKN